jgi:hypothetical protein
MIRLHETKTYEARPARVALQREATTSSMPPFSKKTLRKRRSQKEGDWRVVDVWESQEAFDILLRGDPPPRVGASPLTTARCTFHQCVPPVVRNNTATAGPPTLS